VVSFTTTCSSRRPSRVTTSTCARDLPARCAARGLLRELEGTSPSRGRATPPTAGSTWATRVRSALRSICGSTTPTTRISTPRRRGPGGRLASTPHAHRPYTTQYLAALRGRRLHDARRLRAQGGYRAARRR
jgi:hypothetical protein